MFRRLMERRGWLTHVLVCGMGGSSLTAEVVARAYGATSLHVLDSTDPAAVLDAEGTAPRDRTLFLVVSKSGTTVETLALYRYFAACAPSSPTHLTWADAMPR